MFVIPSTLASRASFKGGENWYLKNLIMAAQLSQKIEPRFRTRRRPSPVNRSIIPPVRPESYLFFYHDSFGRFIFLRASRPTSFLLYIIHERVRYSAAFVRAFRRNQAEGSGCTATLCTGFQSFHAPASHKENI